MICTHDAGFPTLEGRGDVWLNVWYLIWTMRQCIMLCKLVITTTKTMMFKKITMNMTVTMTMTVAAERLETWGRARNPSQIFQSALCVGHLQRKTSLQCQ